MEKLINLNTNVASLIKDYPELKDILFALGFKEIVKPTMLATVGKFMNLKMGANMRNIDLELVVSTLKENGFIVTEE